MKDELDMIFSSNDSDIEKISARYKAVDDKRKERIYEISRRKYNILKAGENESTDDGFIVSAEGVERYSRPQWYRYISAAAAAVVLFGGVCGGVLLSRSSKIQPMSPSGDPNVSAVTGEAATDAVFFDDHEAVDALISNLEMIQKPQYPTNDCVDLSDAIYFNKDEFSDVAGDVVNLTKYYYAVTDEKLDSMTELNDVLRDTFIYETANSYIGGDLSGFEVGYDFGDDNLANKYVKTFIEYNGKVYAQSQCEPNSSYEYNFDKMYDFTGFWLVSSEFANGGQLQHLDRVIHDENSEVVSFDKLVTCKRVYERPDGKYIDLDLQLLPENGVWKIAAFSVSLQNENNDTEHSEYKTPALDNKSADDGEFAELQLHDSIICNSREEAEDLASEIVSARDNGTYQFKKVNTEKYTQQLVNAGSFEELNSLENKSYLYHLVLNSYRYFDTVDLTYTHSGRSADSNWSKTEHCLADNRGKYIYVDYTFDYGESYDQLSMYHYDNKWITADNKNKTFWEYPGEPDTFDDEYVPDNCRFINFYNSEGEEENLYDFRTVVFGQFGSDCLYLSGDYMLNFDYWTIERTEEYLGRQCVVIKLTENYYKGEQYIDLKTGIVLRSTEEFLDSGEYKEMKVTNINIDQPFDYIYFDSTGYTDDSYN